MKRINNGSNILVIIIGIAILFVSIIGITFAYFTVNIEVIVSKKSTLIKSETLIVEFAKNNDIYVRNLIPGRPDYSEDEKYQNELTFTLTSPPNMIVKTVYDVYLNIEKNDFVTNNLVYYLKEDECFRTDGTGSSEGTLQSENFEDYDYDGENVTLGMIPAEKTGRYLISENAVLGGLGCRDTWTLEMWLKELNIEQNEDQARSFKASIEIETKEVLPIEGFTKDDVEEYQQKLEQEKEENKKEEVEKEENEIKPDETIENENTEENKDIENNDNTVQDENEQ